MTFLDQTLIFLDFFEEKNRGKLETEMIQFSQKNVERCGNPHLGPATIGQTKENRLGRNTVDRVGIVGASHEKASRRTPQS